MRLTDYEKGELEEFVYEARLSLPGEAEELADSLVHYVEELVHDRMEIAYSMGAPNPMEYPDDGYEFEYTVRDRNGRHAQWIEDKLTDHDDAKIWSLFYNEYVGN